MKKSRTGPVERRRKRQSGFTLLELLVVLTILGLFAIIATPRVLQYLGGAKSKTAAIQVEQLGGALDLYRLDVGRYPTAEEGIAALVERPAGAERWNGPYVKKKEMLVDPWGEPFRYRVPGQHGPYDLYSLGADKQEGGEGENKDLVSW
ncbi:MAG: type II secretion system major pseudopilin GspG [Alphaproteobacteria bacterium]|nr:type II secretion system major pseudopilin GspG [Alphaproteobacteria bacterium]